MALQRPRVRSTRLVIDDERTHLGGGTHARTSKAGIALLNRPWEQLFLDHDLGPGDDAMAVVDYLCELAHDGRPAQLGMVYVHTQNPVGAQNIIRALERYGYRTKRIGVDQLRAFSRWGMWRWRLQQLSGWLRRATFRT